MKDGKNRLINAVKNNDIERVKTLIAKGANVNVKVPPDGYRALHYAARIRHPQLVKILLAAGADVNAENNRGSTALYCAAINGHDEVGKALLAAGADVNVKSKDGSTALHYATEYGHDEFAKMLFAAKAESMTNKTPTVSEYQCRKNQRKHQESAQFHQNTADEYKNFAEEERKRANRVAAVQKHGHAIRCKWAGCKNYATHLSTFILNAGAGTSEYFCRQHLPKESNSQFCKITNKKLDKCPAE